MSRPRRSAWTAALAWLLCATAQAHIASNGFVVAQVQGSRIAGSVELAVRDVELAIGVDADHDGRVTWGELRAASPQLGRYIQENLQFSTNGQPCGLALGTVQVNDRVDGRYAWMPFSAQCPADIRQLDIRYTPLADIDPSHRGLLTLSAGALAQTAVLGGAGADSRFAVYAPAHWRAFTEYLHAGMLHIWGGVDHLLFLLSLLLPAVLVRTARGWLPVSWPRPAVISILKVVTAFTLAHSITLSLAALDVVRLPSRLTESVIAASIVLAALNNIFPVVTESRSRIAFTFGLLHGFGFASVLADMGLPQGSRLLSLVAFNLGIEVGQLAVVLAVMPVVYGLRPTRFYRRIVMPWGSAAIAALALVWLIQRALFPTG
jgi:HupE / UreJ protein